MISYLKFKHYLRLLKRNSDILKQHKLKKIINYIKYKNYPFEIDTRINRVAPVYTSILATRRCNLRCSFCVVGKMIASQSGEHDLTVSQMRKLLATKLISRSLMIMFTGGEPLLNKDLPEIIRQCKQQGHIVSVTTNGVLLANRITSLVDAGIDSISVSVYDANFKVLQKTLPQLTPVFPIRLNRVISRSGVERFPEKIAATAELAVKTGCYGIIFQNMMPTGKTDLREVIFSGNQSYARLKRAIHKHYGKKLQINWAAEARAHIRGKQDKKCRQAWYLNVVDAQGNLGLCCRCQQPVYGNIFDQHTSDIRNTTVWRNFRAKLLSASSDIPDECRYCFLNNDSLSGDV